MVSSREPLMQNTLVDKGLAPAPGDGSSEDRLSRKVGEAMLAVSTPGCTGCRCVGVRVSLPRKSGNVSGCTALTTRRLTASIEAVCILVLVT